MAKVRKDVHDQMQMTLTVEIFFFFFFSLIGIDERVLETWKQFYVCFLNGIVY